jgi:outer membrane lipoprotein YfiO
VVFSRYFRLASSKTLIGVFLIALFIASPAYSVDTKDSQIFITGFNAYLKRDYQTAIENLTSVLEKYPDTSLRDMAILWLSRSYFKAGNQKEAARYMAQFFKEYPDSPLKGTVEDELAELAAKYQRGEPVAAEQVAKAAAAPPAVVVAPVTGGAEKLPAPAQDETARLAAEKAAGEKADLERVAAAKAEADRKAAEKIVMEKAEADRKASEMVAMEKAEADRLAAEKAANEKTDLERVAAVKAEADRKASEKAAMEKAEADRKASEKAAMEKAEADRKASEMAAMEKAEADRKASEKTAMEKAEADRKASEKAAMEKAEAERSVVATAAKQKDLETSLSLRNQAISEYKAVVDSYPGSQAAANAINRLKELGIDYPAVVSAKAGSTAQTTESSSILSVEVDRLAVVEFTLAAEQQTVEIGKRFAVPFEVTNRGNSPDSFIFESGLPKEYKTIFVASAAPDKPLTKTPQLLPGERFNGMIQFEMPTMSIDGERKLFPVKVLSEADSLISQSRPIKLIAKAPILRAVIKSDVALVSPGERIPYKLVLLNVGSAAAKEVSLHVAFPPQYEPVDAAAAGFRPEGSNMLVMNGLQLTPGESREIAFTMQLKESALAREELFIHADMINTSLNRTDKFVSAAVAVKPVSGFTVQANTEKIIAGPGQTVSVLLSVANTGNVRDDFVIKPLPASSLSYAFYLDTNRDGIRQAGEPIVSHVGPLAPREVSNLILEITTSASEKDGTVVPLLITLDSQSDPSKKVSANLSLVYSRPVLNLTVAGKGGKIRPGEVSSFELSCVNVGSSMAKMVDIRSSLPEQLELVAANPVVAGRNDGEYFWKFDELGSGEKRKISVSYRIKPGIASGTSLALKNVIKYQDQAGNSY